MNGNQIVLFESNDREVTIPVVVDKGSETVWLTRNEMSALFDRDVKTIGKHINNALKEELSDDDSVVAKFATTAADGKRYQTDHYSLDMILSIGYRVKSQRGVEFRRWATNVLHKLIIQGHVENERRLEQLGTVAQIIKRLPEDLGSREILDIVESYIDVFKLLDEYDRESIDRPKGQTGIYTLEYELCMRLIAQMRSRFTSDLFGVEKDESFRSSISVINQSFGGQDLYLSVQEKAANLLYLIIKNHSFLDGNKRIGCSLFLYYLDRNGLLFRGLDKRIADSTLVAVALMIAESRPEEKESMVSLVMNFLE